MDRKVHFRNLFLYYKSPPPNFNNVCYRRIQQIGAFLTQLSVVHMETYSMQSRTNLHRNIHIYQSTGNIYRTRAIYVYMYIYIIYIKGLYLALLIYILLSLVTALQGVRTPWLQGVTELKRNETYLQRGAHGSIGGT